MLLLAPLAGLSAAQSQNPNILFIFADDWGWGDLGCHGHPYVKTPKIDRLAAEGTDFNRFTGASGVCSPSRTAVMTGQFPACHYIDGHFAWPKDNARRNTPFHVVPKYTWRFRDLDEPNDIYASVRSHADDRIGQVLDALDRLKISDNPLVPSLSTMDPQEQPPKPDPDCFSADRSD